mmetsp:Transcript_535/g.1618  ORF Transcript_535/g.1618 Transcript_535/m.1618 type:complete len:117 (-) Transcript_535:668-1018(-)
MEDPEFVSAEGLQVLARKSSPGAGELARLVHVMGSPDVSAALDQLVEGFKDRQVMDDRVGRMLPWVEFSTLYNSQDFKPANAFLQEPEVCGQLRPTGALLQCSLGRKDSGGLMMMC